MGPSSIITRASLFLALLGVTFINYGFNNLYAEEKEIPIEGALFPETETQFSGTSKEVGDFQATFSRDKKGDSLLTFPLIFSCAPVEHLNII